MKNLQFNYNMSFFDIEKLKLMYMRLFQQDNGGGASFGDEPDSVGVSYCKNCKDKLKTLNIKLEENQMVCDICNNLDICKIHEDLNKIKNHLEFIDFMCPYFIPHNKFLDNK